MDMMTIISSLVAASIAYLKTQAAQKIGEKAAEKVGEKAGESLINVGDRTLTTIRSWFAGDNEKAQQVLTRFEANPDDQLLQQLLAEEVEAAAKGHPSRVQELQKLAEQLTLTRQEGVVINNQAPNEGAQGVFNAPVTFTRTTNTKDDA
jgi:hypothetical protein